MLVFEQWYLSRKNLSYFSFTQPRKTCQGKPASAPEKYTSNFVVIVLAAICTSVLHRSDCKVLLIYIGHIHEIDPMVIHSSINFIKLNLTIAMRVFMV